MPDSPTVLTTRLRAADANAPTRLSHLALITYDAGATTEFYTKVMRMELVAAVMHERVPSTGDRMPYLHIFFRMQDGSTIAFFEVPDLPRAAPSTHPAQDVFNHVALEVASVELVDEWREWLTSRGVDVLGPVDHALIYSVYFYDPNGIRLEITTPLRDDWNDTPVAARSAVDAWIKTKAHAKQEGLDVSLALHHLVTDNDPTFD